MSAPGAPVEPWPGEDTVLGASCDEQETNFVYWSARSNSVEMNGSAASRTCGISISKLWSSPGFEDT
jgi:hypothetical protein